MTRRKRLSRKTKETDVSVRLDLDGTGKYAINLPDKWLKHMLESVAARIRAEFKDDSVILDPLTSLLAQARPTLEALQSSAPVFVGVSRRPHSSVR